MKLYIEEDAPFFFGREEEREIITANLISSPITLLYSPSDVGKSSVLPAGYAGVPSGEIAPTLEKLSSGELRILRSGAPPAISPQRRVTKSFTMCSPRRVLILKLHSLIGRTDRERDSHVITKDIEQQLPAAVQ